ncbi:MAG: hypothetical protein M3220_00530 [Chloroflexota bacterium]|nr:hypothetical protein [Chloroflexota bacterium]
MENYDRLSIVVSLVLLGLVMMLLINLPTRIIQAELFGTPVAIPLSSHLIMAALLSTLTAVGVETIMRSHPRFGEQRVSAYSFPFWILPALVTLAATWLTPLLLQYSLLYWLGGLVATAIALSLVIMAEYHTITPADRHYTQARLFLNMVAYLGGLVLFSLVYSARLRSALSASSIALLAATLALSLLRADREETARTWTYAAICGLILGEATWALNYWGIGGLTGGTLLVLIFYFFTGLAQQQLLNRFGRPVLIEFGLVGTVGLFLLATQGALSW